MMKYGSEEKAYLSAILDLKGKDIVSFAIGKSNNNQLVFETFDLAVKNIRMLIRCFTVTEDSNTQASSLKQT